MFHACTVLGLGAALVLGGALAASAADHFGGLKDELVASSSGNALYMEFGYRFLYLVDVKTGDLTWTGTNLGVGTKVKSVMAQKVRDGLR